MAHYFTNDDVKSNIIQIKSIINKKEYCFFTDNNVFSKNGIDFGTKLLLENLNNIHGKVLDVGCGYGPIGIYLKLNYDCYVDMIDVNQRALDLSNLNIKSNSIGKINCFLSDAYSNVKGIYDYIITNPPIRAGKTKVYEILFGAFEHLKDDGKLIFVIRKEQGAKSTIKDLNEKYKISIIAKKSGFFIICAEKNIKTI